MAIQFEILKNILRPAKIGNWIMKCLLGKRSARIQQLANGSMLEIRSCAQSVKSGVHIGCWTNRAPSPKLRIFLTTMQQSHFLLQCRFGVSKLVFSDNHKNVKCKLSRAAVYLKYNQYPPIISISAVVFLELWKRKQAVIAWEWDLTKFEEDEPLRPQYEAKVKTTRYDDLPLLYLK